MSDNTEEQLDPRTDSIIYSRVSPINDSLKSKVNNAFLDIVTRFKNKHLS